MRFLKYLNCSFNASLDGGLLLLTYNVSNMIPMCIMTRGQEPKPGSKLDLNPVMHIHGDISGRDPFFVNLPSQSVDVRNQQLQLMIILTLY